MKIKALKFFAQHELDYIQYQVTAADKALREGTGPGNDFTGWIDLPKDYDKAVMWAKRSARQGNIDAQDILKQLGETW